MTEEQWMEEGGNHANAKRYQQALAAYEQATRLNPASADAYLQKGLTLEKLGRLTEALAAIEQAIRLKPNDYLPHLFKVVTLYNHQRYTEAVAACEQAIRLAPMDADTKASFFYKLKGEALFLLHRFQEALTAFEQGIQLAPNNAVLYCCKGGALEALDRYEEALAAYEQSIRLDPTAEEPRSGRERVLEELRGSARWWVVRRGPRDKDSRGNFHSMEKYAGPFSTREEAQVRAQEARGSLQNYFGEIRRAGEGYAEELRSRFGSVFLETDYVALSENELEEARRRGIRIY